MSDLLPLPIGQVDIWLTSLANIGQEQRRSLERRLSESELMRLRKFVAHGTQLQYLVARALVRTTLSRYADVPNDAWRFETNPFGRPYVTEPARVRNIRFNLSHTDELVACAVANDCDIGVDVEDIRCDLDFDAVALTFFSPAENAGMSGIRPEARRNYFYSCWTLKEAYLKARGVGLSIPADGFSFDLHGQEPQLCLAEYFDNFQLWHFYQTTPTPNHKLAAAVSGCAKSADFRLRWALPLDMQ